MNLRKIIETTTFSRPPDDRRKKDKEKNKEACVRYRAKRKKMVQDLEKKNADLEREKADLEEENQRLRAAKGRNDNLITGQQFAQ